MTICFTVYQFGMEKRNVEESNIILIRSNPELSGIIESDN